MASRSNLAWAVPAVIVLMLLVLAALATQAAVAQGLAQVCPALQLDNPNPGDTLMAGGYLVSGIAFDPSASLGSGVSRIDFYLGSRDAGGLILGSAQSNPDPNSFGPPRFQIQLTIPKLTISSTEFVAYAIDASTGGETSVAVPVRVGDVTPPRGQPTPTAQVSSTCEAVATPVNLAPPLPAEIAFTPTPGPQLAGTPAPLGAPLAAAPGPVFELSNPNAGDLLPLGGYVVSGIAYDPASTSGPGVDRIQFFLDPRENGGWLLGSAVPSAAAPGEAPSFKATIFVPNGAVRGAHLLVAYARSSVIGQEAIVSVPVFIGEKPTPTPLPA